MTVRFAGTLSEEQLPHFRELCTPVTTKKSPKFYPWILTGVGLCSLILLSELAIDILPILIISGLLLWVQQQTRRTIPLAWKSSKFLHTHTQGQASSSSLVWKNQYLSAQYPWDLFLTYKTNGKSAAIFFAKNNAIIIPRAFFRSHDEWCKVIDSVADRVKARS